MIRQLAIALLFVVTLTSRVAAACSGVDHSAPVVQGMQYNTFVEAGTSTPLTVSLTITDVGVGTSIEVDTGSSWEAVNGPTTVGAEQVRTSAGGSARISYTYLTCSEEIQTPGEE